MSRLALLAVAAISLAGCANPRHPAEMPTTGVAVPQSAPPDADAAQRARRDGAAAAGSGVRSD